MEEKSLPLPFEFENLLDKGKFSLSLFLLEIKKSTMMIVSS